MNYIYILLKISLKNIENWNVISVFFWIKTSFLLGSKLYFQNIWLGCCMRANFMLEISSNQPSLIACPRHMWSATVLRFYYIGDTDPESKLAIGNGHLWSWDGFMAARIWAINFAKKNSYLQCVSRVLSSLYKVMTSCLNGLNCVIRR